MNYILSFVLLTLFSCTKANSGPNLIYKKSYDDSVIVKIDGVEIKGDKFYQGIEADIYDAQEKIYQLKMKRLNSLLLEYMMKKDHRSKKMSNDEFMDKVIAKNLKVTSKEIDAFIKKRSIPTEHLNEQMKAKIEGFLVMEKKRDAVQKWIGKMTKDHPVEVFFSKPLRPVSDVKVGDAPIIGDKNAPITIVGFSDFQCPFCARGATIVDEVMKKYKGKVRVAFKHFPLPFHKNAKIASEASMCANDQSAKFFEQFHDFFYKNQDKLARSDIEKFAKTTKIKMDVFTKCLDSHKYKKVVLEDFKYGQTLGVKATPTFYVNGRLINGALSIEVFSEVIDDILLK